MQAAAQILRSCLEVVVSGNDKGLCYFVNPSSQNDIAYLNCAETHYRYLLVVLHFSGIKFSTYRIDVL